MIKWIEGSKSLQKAWRNYRMAPSLVRDTR